MALLCSGAVGDGEMRRVEQHYCFDETTLVDVFVVIVFIGGGDGDGVPFFPSCSFFPGSCSKNNVSSSNNSSSSSSNICNRMRSRRRRSFIETVVGLEREGSKSILELY